MCLKFSHYILASVQNIRVFSFQGFDKVAELLIQNGADVNIIGENGKTALILSAEKGKMSFKIYMFGIFVDNDNRPPN